MFNVHIGLPGLLPDILHKHSVPKSDLEFASSKLLTREEYEINFQRLIFRPGKAGAQDPLAVKQAAIFIEKLLQNKNVAISQPNVLGPQAQVYNSAGILPFAETSVRRLSKLLNQGEVAFHLLITNQVDYILAMARLPRVEKEKLIINSNVSWVRLVERLRNAVPNRQITVWDIERPSIVAPLFISDLLRTPIRLSNESGVELPSRDRYTLADEIQDQASGELLASIYNLDNQYEDDLEAIGRLDNIRLIGAESYLLD
jgi:hypothetical protein